MKDKELPIDLNKHKAYSKSVKRCVKKLLHRYYNNETADVLWQKVQLQYCEYLKDEPPLAGLKITRSIYDPILIFAWYTVVPDKPPLEDIQKDVYECFFGSFDMLGKVFDLNRKLDNRLAGMIFKKANDIREEETIKFPESFSMGYSSYDKENGVIRYSFTQCPNAQFAKRHHLEDVLPLLCNCDHMAMVRLHASLIREQTCGIGDCCDYCIVGDRNPLALKYELKKEDNGLWLSVRK